MRGPDCGGVLIDDVVLPAAAHLTGPGARRVLQAAVDAADGELGAARACYVHYRPGHDVVVRYDASISWAGAPAVEETIVAASTADGAPAGTLPLGATTADGTSLTVGVWRWPFDPVVTGITDAVVPSAAAGFLDGLVAGRLQLEVVAFRPMQRAVVRAVDERGRVLYLKAVRPAETQALVDRHERLCSGGIPVPRVIHSDPERGLIAMEELAGRTVRDLVRAGETDLPGPDEYERLFEALAGVELEARSSVASRCDSGVRHASMLATVMPQDRWRLELLTDALVPAIERAAARSGPTVHGDLYEAQLVTGTGESGRPVITGVLDIDDAGRGDPLDDRATVLAHLSSRALSATPEHRRQLLEHVDVLRTAFCRRLAPADAGDLDLVTAGALIGLATGPFRIQARRWRHASRRHLVAADRLVRRALGEPTSRSSPRMEREEPLTAAS